MYNTWACVKTAFIIKYERNDNVAQNPYNNYIKRQAQLNVGTNNTIAPKPTDTTANFKKRIVGNLGAISTPAPTTAIAPTNTVKPQNTSSQTVNQYTAPEQSTPKANIRSVEAPQVANDINTPVQVSETPTQALNTPEANPNMVNETVAPLQVDNAPEMYANTRLARTVTPEVATETPQTISETPISEKTAEQIAYETYQQQKEQAQKDWELKQQQIAQQQEQAMNSYNQSVKDTDAKYQESVDKLNLNRYNQQEDMNVSATRRGLSYSAQALAIENVANINHNKNLAEASKQRNEMLKELNIKLGELKAQISLSGQNALNEFNKSIMDLTTNYNNTIMNWKKDKELTESERAWEAEQDAKNKAWQVEQDEKNKAWQSEQTRLEREWKEQQEKLEREWEAQQTLAQREWQAQQDQAQRDWQSSENALDRAKYSRSSTGYSGYGGYSGYSRYNGYNGYDYDNGYSTSSLQLADDTDSSVYLKTFKQMSTDVYNALASSNNLNTVEDNASIYMAQIDDEITYAQQNGASSELIAEMIATRDTALKHLYNNAYAKSTNTAYKTNANTVTTYLSPLSEDYINKNKNTRISNQQAYIANTTLDKDAKKKAEAIRDVMAVYENNRKYTKYGVSSDISKKMRDGSYSSNNTSKTKTTSSNNSKAKEQAKKITKQVSKASTGSGIKETEYSKKVRKNVAKTAKNTATTTKKAVETTKKAVKKLLSWKIKK